jgi:hypothetical protein
MTSLKKLIAVLAVTLPLAATAQQAAPPAAPLYQWYGTLNVNGQYYEASKPTPSATAANVTGRIGVSVDSSNIGIKGTADTGQFGLGLVYQCETSAPIDGVGANVTQTQTGATAGAVATALQFVCNRNSRLGITHAYGTLFYGNWDSPYKAAWYGTKADDAFGNTDIYDAAGIMGSPGGKTTSTAGVTAPATPVGPQPAAVAPAVAPPAPSAATFNVRAANTIAYHSPKIQGVQVKLQVTPNENASVNGKYTGNLYSAAINYDRGPISVLAAYERHDDWNGLGVVGATGFDATKNTVDQGVKAGAGYELANPFGTTTIGAVWELLMLGYQHNAGLAATAVKSYDRQAFMVNLKHRMGNHEFRARYEYADNGTCKLAGGATCNFDIGKGAQNYALGYAYYLTSAAQVYAFFTKIENERGATYTTATAGPPSKSSFTAGADPMGAGLGIRYAF